MSATAVTAADEARRERRRAVAAAWYEALTGLAYIPFPVGEVRLRLEDLLARALDALTGSGESADVIEVGRALGRDLVDLHVSQPAGLERSLALLSDALPAALSDEPAFRPERLGLLLAGFASGYAGAMQDIVLRQQEGVGLASTAALKRARRDLEAQRDSLSRTNQELQQQIAERLRAETKLRSAIERLHHLHQISVAVLEAESLNGIVEIVIKYIQEQIPCLNASVALYDWDSNTSMVVLSNRAEFPSGARFDVSLSEGIATLSTGRIYYVRDLWPLRDDSVGMRAVVEMGGRSLLIVPLLVGGDLIGGLSIITADVREFTQEQVEIAREMCDLVALAIQNRMLLDAERVARQRETTLREVAGSLTSGLDLEVVLDRILDQLDYVIASAGSSIVLRDGETLTVASMRRSEAAAPLFHGPFAAPPPNLTRVLTSGRPLLVPDTRTDPEWIVMEGSEYIRNWLGLPLLVKGGCIGVLTLDRDVPDSFTPQDMELAMAFASQAAIVIENARLFRQEQQYAEQLEARVHERTRELEALYRMTAAAAEELELETVLVRSLEQTTAAFSWPAAALLLLDPDGSHFGLAAYHDPSGDLWTDRLRDLPPDHALLELLLARPEPTVVQDRALLQSAAGPALAAGAGVPLRVRGRLIGVLALFTRDDRQATTLSSKLLTTIADQIATSVENIQLRQRARQAAIHEERERLARELHDAVTQTLYSLSLFTEAARDSGQAGDMARVRRHLDTIGRMTQQALAEMRLLLFELRTETLAQKGLVNALRERIDTVERRAEIEPDLTVGEIGELPVVLEDAFYRVALEALNNSLRHAHADLVEIVLGTADGWLEMTITDNGVGFAPDAVGTGGMGLGSMRKRVEKVGGILELVSEPGAGARVVVRAPLAVEANGVS